MSTLNSGRSVIVVVTTLLLSLVAAPSALAWERPGLSVKQTRVAEICGVRSIQAADGSGPSTIHMTVSRQIMTEVSGKFGASNEMISAEVGAKIGETQGVSLSYDYAIPDGQLGRLTAYPMYRIHEFDVFDKPFFGKKKKIGSGEVWEPFSVCFVGQQVG